MAASGRLTSPLLSTFILSFSDWRVHGSNLVHLAETPVSDRVDMGNGTLIACRPCVSRPFGSGALFGGHVNEDNRMWLGVAVRQSTAPLSNQGTDCRVTAHIHKKRYDNPNPARLRLASPKYVSRAFSFRRITHQPKLRIDSVIHIWLARRLR